MTETSIPEEARPVSHISTLWAWLFVGLLVVAVVVGVMGRVFSAAVVLDLVSFWPFLVVVFLVAATLLPRARGRWLASVVPMLLIGWLVTAIALHVAAWDQLPSSAARLVGPVHVGTASLTVDMPGLLHVTASDQPDSYIVSPRRAGGPVGAPEAIERQDGTELSAALRPIETSRWFRAEGWDVTLDQRIDWALDITATTAELDLSGLAVSLLAFAGNGTVSLGDLSERAVEVQVTGNVDLVIEPGSVVQIIGDADVPARYVPTEDGFISADGGEPSVVVRVLGGSVSITEAGPSGDGP